MLWYSLALASFVPLGLGKPVSRRWDDMTIKHAWNGVPANWISLGAPVEDTTIDLRLKLKSSDEHAIIKALYEVSDPAHPKYGAHLSKEAVAELVAPHSDTSELVSAWLEDHDIPTDSVRPVLSGDWLMLTAVPISTANTLLGASYEVYEHAQSGERILRTTSYSLPSVLHGHVSTVSPTTYFGSPRAFRATHRIVQTDSTRVGATDADLGSDATVPSSCASTITPACLKALYNTTGYTPQATDKNIIGVTGYLEQFANFADLTTFANRFLTDASNATFAVELINGGVNNQSDPGAEANLDIQYTTGISFPTPQIFYSTGGSPPFNPDDATPTNTNEPYLDFLNFLFDQDTIPQTLSTSYGDDEQTVPQDYAIEVCNLFAQLGAQGTSVLFSSGDSGVGSNGDCVSNDGKNTQMFLPAFPASCPYVTAVGSTKGINPEVPTTEFSSGGGFSNYFAVPDYQSDVVSSYISGIGSTNAGLFNTSGRGYPDIAAQGQHFQVIIGGSVASLDGTSCSAPTASGVIGLLNDFLLSQGKSPLGFLNPLIYSTGATAFNDITSGNNAGCDTNGFEAKAGWDPVSGLGTPDFGKLQAIVG